MDIAIRLSDVGPSLYVQVVTPYSFVSVLIQGCHFPAFSGFPGFLSVQCKFVINFFFSFESLF